MKITARSIAAIALIAAIGFQAASCGNGDDGGGNNNGNNNGTANATPSAADYNVSGLSQIFDNTPRNVTVTAKPGKSTGAVTVKYNGSTTAPSAVGSYAVTFDVAAAAGWNPASGLQAGTLTIANQSPNAQTPAASDFTVGNLSQTAGSVTAVTVTPKQGKSQGQVTVKYDGSTAIPQTAGSYAVTFDVSASEGWNAAAGLSAGTLAVSPASSGGLAKLGISINRADSSDTQFTFKVNPAVVGATGYKALKGTAEVGSSASTSVSVPGSNLSSSAYTGLTAKAVKGAADASLATALPGMLKYPAATPTLNGYTDWFNFLFESMGVVTRVNPSALTTNMKNFKKTIKSILENNDLTDEATAIDYKNSLTDDANLAMDAVLNNFDGIMNLLSNSTDPTDVETLRIINETLPRLWFNKVADQGNNDAVLNGIMKSLIQADYPDVQTVE